MRFNNEHKSSFIYSSQLVFLKKAMTVLYFASLTCSVLPVKINKWIRKKKREIEEKRNKTSACIKLYETQKPNQLNSHFVQNHSLYNTKKLIRDVLDEKFTSNKFRCFSSFCLVIKYFIPVINKLLQLPTVIKQAMT